MTFTAYVPLTVGRGSTVTFTTYGHPGVATDHVLLAEDGTALLTESGDLLLTA